MTTMMTSLRRTSRSATYRMAMAVRPTRITASQAVTAPSTLQALQTKASGLEWPMIFMPPRNQKHCEQGVGTLRGVGTASHLWRWSGK